MCQTIITIIIIIIIHIVDAVSASIDVASSFCLTLIYGSIQRRPGASQATADSLGVSLSEAAEMAPAVMAVAAAGMSLNWNPDAHFMLQEVAAAGQRVSASRAAAATARAPPTPVAGAPTRPIISLTKAVSVTEATRVGVTLSHKRCSLRVEKRTSVSPWSLVHFSAQPVPFIY